MDVTIGVCVHESERETKIESDRQIESERHSDKEQEAQYNRVYPLSQAIDKGLKFLI